MSLGGKPCVLLTLVCYTPQVRDFLQRVKSKRFPSIEKDMSMVLAHCGSLFLDPAALQEVRIMDCLYKFVLAESKGG